MAKDKGFSVPGIISLILQDPSCLLHDTYLPEAQLQRPLARRISELNQTTNCREVPQKTSQAKAHRPQGNFHAHRTRSCVIQPYFLALVGRIRRAQVSPITTLASTRLRLSTKAGIICAQRPLPIQPPSCLSSGVSKHIRKPNQRSDFASPTSYNLHSLLSRSTTLHTPSPR